VEYRVSNAEGSGDGGVAAGELGANGAGIGVYGTGSGGVEDPGIGAGDSGALPPVGVDLGIGGGAAAVVADAAEGGLGESSSSPQKEHLGLSVKFFFPQCGQVLGLDICNLFAFNGVVP
jgi:hypothetical protein